MAGNQYIVLTFVASNAVQEIQENLLNSSYGNFNCLVLRAVMVPATVTLGNLNQTYDGTAKSVTATTTPANLTVNITYGGSANAPANAGSYTVIGTINDAHYQGSATNTLVISKAISPQMSLALVGMNLSVSWSQTNTGFTVQFCTNLMLGGWLNVTSPAPRIVSNQWQVALPATNAGSMFYRLVK
jgi:hypothetical protein